MPASSNSRRVRLIGTAPEVIEPNGRRMRFSGPGFQGLRTPGSAPWIDRHAKPLVDSTSDDEIGRLTDAHWSPDRGAVVGTLTLFPPGTTSAADRQRRLLAQGSDRLSIRYVPVGDRGQVRADDGALDVLAWQISHVASVGEPADVYAGDEMSVADGSYELSVVIDWGEEVIMPEPAQDLNQLATALPGMIADGIAAGFARQEQARREAESAAAAELERQAQAQRIADLESRLHAAENLEPEPEEPEPEPEPEEPEEPEPDAEQLNALLDIAASQPEFYSPEELTRLRMDVAQRLIPDGAALRAKLESIHINPKPIAPGLSNEGDYSIERALRSIAHGDLSMAPVEHARSNDILGATNMAYSTGRGSGMAIPMSAIREQRVDPSFDLATRVSTGAMASQNAEELVIDDLVEYYRADIPDPLEILPLIPRVASRPGDPRFVRITTPTPGTVAEPGVRPAATDHSVDADAHAGVTQGYAETGDSSTADHSMGPQILAVYTSMTRLADVQSPMFMSQVMSILMNKMDEVRNEQVIDALYARTDANRNLDHSRVSAELTAAYTVTQMDAAIDNSWRYENLAGANRAVVTTVAGRSTLRNLANPTAVGRYSDGMTVRGLPIHATGHLARHQAVVGPFGLLRMKEWDGSVYVSSRYEAGIQYMLLELFWNWTLLPEPHAAEFYVLLDAA